MYIYIIIICMACTDLSNRQQWHIHIYTQIVQECGSYVCTYMWVCSGIFLRHPLFGLCRSLPLRHYKTNVHIVCCNIGNQWAINIYVAIIKWLPGNATVITSVFYAKQNWLAYLYLNQFRASYTPVGRSDYMNKFLPLSKYVHGHHVGGWNLCSCVWCIL